MRQLVLQLRVRLVASEVAWVWQDYVGEIEAVLRCFACAIPGETADAHMPRIHILSSSQTQAVIDLVPNTVKCLLRVRAKQNIHALLLVGV